MERGFVAIGLTAVVTTATRFAIDYSASVVVFAICGMILTAIAIIYQIKLGNKPAEHCLALLAFAALAIIPLCGLHRHRISETSLQLGQTTWLLLIFAFFVVTLTKHRHKLLHRK